MMLCFFELCWVSENALLSFFCFGELEFGKWLMVFIPAEKDWNFGMK